MITRLPGVKTHELAAPMQTGIDRVLTGTLARARRFLAMKTTLAPVRALRVAVLLTATALVFGSIYVVFEARGGIDRARREEDARLAAALAAFERARVRSFREAATAAGQAVSFVRRDDRWCGPFWSPAPSDEPVREPDALERKAIAAVDAGAFALGEAQFARLESRDSAPSAEAVLARSRALVALEQIDAAVELLLAAADRDGRRVRLGLPFGFSARLAAARQATKAGRTDLTVRALSDFLELTAPLPENGLNVVLEAVALAEPKNSTAGDLLRATARVAGLTAAGLFEAPPVGAVAYRPVPVLRTSEESFLVLAPEIAAAATARAERELTQNGEFHFGSGEPPSAKRRDAHRDARGDTWAAFAGDRPSEVAERTSRRSALAALGAAALAAGALLLLLMRERRLARLKATFVDLVSHELRTPLAALSLRTEMLQERDLTDDRRAHHTAALATETARLNHLVGRLLDFSRLERAAAGAATEEVSIRAIFARVARLLRGTLRAAGKRLVVETSADLASVPADPDLLERALSNLVENASKYAPAGTRVVLRVASGLDMARFEVEDEGPGVTEEEKTEIFAPFVRGRAARAGGAPGNGLGLAFVAHAARLHGGRSGVRSAAGRSGAVFWIDLPLRSRA